MILKTSKFFSFCYADELQEKEFFAKKFKASLDQQSVVFSFVLMRGLDVEQLKPQLKQYTFYEIEDVYLRNKLIHFLKENSQIKKMSLELNTSKSYIKQLKFTNKGFIFQLI